MDLTEQDISPYSYRSGDGFRIALEEDCDAGIFMNRWLIRNNRLPEFDEVDVDGKPGCPRNWRSFGSSENPRDPELIVQEAKTAKALRQKLREAQQEKIA